MLSSRHCAALLTIACTVTALAGCSTSASDRETTTSVSPSAAVSDDVDLSRLAELRDDFPPGLSPETPSEPDKVSAQYAHLVGDAVSYGDPFTVDPPECRPLLKPVDAAGGADKMGIGAGGPKPPVLVVSAVNPVAVPDPLPATGCDRMAFEVDGAIPDGTAERLAAPDIDGAITYAFRIDHGEGVEYVYIAILDGRTYVQVRARMAPSFQAEPLLPDLLSKAVAAIRG